MQTELRQFIDQARFYRGSVEQVAGMLPQDDAELDALIAEIVRENDQHAFIYVVMGALSRERRVDAKHLKLGAMLLPFHQWLGCVALRMHGDVPENLLAAIQNTKLTPKMETVSLFLAATWCQEHREGVLPIGLIATARLRARRQELDSNITPFLLALALQAKDAGLNAILRKNVPNASDEAWKKVEDSALNLVAQWREIWRRPILESINEKPGNELARGATMRRAVARLGRNEPCHCGSGKKYKNCCLEKDHERLHHSSEVAGRTREELHADPERYLTAARMDKTGAHELARFDPTKIPEPLQKTYIQRLCAFNLLDRLVEAFEKTGYSDAKLFSWESAVLFITRAGRKDLLLRMINLRPNPAEVEGQIFIGSALLLKDDDPAKVLTIIEECAVDVVKSEDPEDIYGFSYGLLYSKFPALGILAARGAIPIVPQKDASRLFEEILKARDKLTLPPDDPFSDVIDKRFANHEHEEKESAGLRKARQNLNDKAQEVRQLKESLAQLQKEIARREEKPAGATINTPSIAPVPADESALKELRKKVELLQSTLKERHQERNELRRELQKTSADLETLRENPTIAAPKEPEALDHEEELLLPQDALEVHPVRLIEFPKGFHQTLTGFPRHVARATMIMIGRLAAGEPASFVGALRLKATPNIMRQRIGSDYRLLFRLHPDHLQVIDLINRKDLDRRLKTLV